jgi:hypothetical protein
MKRYILSALTAVLAAGANLFVQAIEPASAQRKAVEDIQSHRLERLDTQRKAVEDIQSHRLDVLDLKSQANARQLLID